MGIINQKIKKTGIECVFSIPVTVITLNEALFFALCRDACFVYYQIFSIHQTVPVVDAGNVNLSWHFVLLIMHFTLPSFVSILFIR